MPSRRAPRPSKNNKLTTHLTSDGWTHVGRRLHAVPMSTSVPTGVALRALLERLTPAQAALYTSLSAAQGPASMTLRREPKEARGVSVHDVRARYERIAAQWRASTARVGLRRILEQRGEGLRSVTKAVCLGLGSLSGETGAAHAMWQLAAFVDSVEMIKDISKSAGTIQTFAQDPVFNSLDEALLVDLDITVLQDPRGFGEIDESAFVFAPHYPIAGWSAEMRNGDVPLLIGNHVSEGLDHVPELDEVKRMYARFLAGEEGTELEIPDLEAKAELRAFVKSRASASFPRLDEDEHAFMGLLVYWKESE